ncbi:kinesin-like protein KIF20B [Gastrophryne carolinensis]
MKPTEEQHNHPRPSYVGEGISLPERDEPQDIDDIRTNLSEQFLMLDDAEKSASEYMHVYLRVRPFAESEMEQNESQDCVSIPDARSVLVKPPLNSQASRLSEKGGGAMAQKFSFSHVYGPETTQAQFFEGTVKKQVTDFMKGQSRLIFTYGVTNAGKTFTFQGSKGNAGILPRSMELLFHTIEGKIYQKMDIKPYRCRDYIRLNKEQLKREVAFKNSVLRHTKEADSQCSIRSNISRTSVDTTDLLADEGPSDSSHLLSGCEERLRDLEELGLHVNESTRFSVWVSFCEIYNECIYDLLDPVTGDKSYKRKTLKLCQDLKGFSFVKDLQWVQVSDAKEACRILSLGKKFQSIAFTKLNSSSSRSHSIFTVRLLKIEDVDTPRVLKVSELALCDLAGSERCTKTHNEGERLKESGNINTSLLILGKCINALKQSQNSKLPHHVPFRESKLTHYLQSFFTGKGKVVMIVNISQVASAYDETLNVLKFSAVAQKVLVLESSNTLESHQQKNAREVSFIINNADNKRWMSRRRATVQWDSCLEDVLEDDVYASNSEDEECLDCTNLEEEADEEEEAEEEEVIIKREAYTKLLELIEDLKTQLVNEKKDKILMELKIREEVAEEFAQHFMQRENDFSERLQKEKELMEERCDERLEIFQDLVRKCSNSEEEEDAKAPCSVTHNDKQVDSNLPLQGLFSSIQNDLEVIRKQAEEAHYQIAAIQDDPTTVSELRNKIQEMEDALNRSQEELKRKTAEQEEQIEKFKFITLQLEEANGKLLAKTQHASQLMDMMQEKDTAIQKLQNLITHWESKCEDYEKTVSSIQDEMAKFSSSGDVRSKSLKRPPVDHHLAEDQPPSKKELLDSSSSDMESGSKKDSSPEKMDTLQVLEETRVENKQYRIQAATLNQTIEEFKEKLIRCEEQVVNLESKNKAITDELLAEKALTSTLEGTVATLKQEINCSKLNIDSKVAQIENIQSKIDGFGKNEVKPDSEGKSFNLENESSSKKQTPGMEGLARKMVSGRESAFYSAIEGLWNKCHNVLQESANKNKQIHNLEEELADLKNKMAAFQNTKEQLQIQIQEAFTQSSILKEKDHLITQLQEQLSETTSNLERHKKQEIDYKNELLLNSQKIQDLERIADSYKCEKRTILEETEEKSVAFQTLEKRLADLQAGHVDCEKNHQKLATEKTELEQKIKQAQEELAAAQTAKNASAKQVAEATKEIELLKKEHAHQASLLKTTQLDLQRKNEDYLELKEKLADVKKQMQQVEKEICAMREEKKTLTNKTNDLEKQKKQMSCDLEMKQRTIQQLSKERDEKTEDTMLPYQKVCKDLKAKEKIIEDMKLTLIEQEETQEEQEQALEAKVEEARKLAEELELWKHKYKELEKISNREILTKMSNETNNNMETVSSEVTKLQAELNAFEEKYSNDRKKWLEEKKTLISQAKEAENHRNKEMRKFVEDRERYTKQQAEMEHLSAQLAEKEKTLQKWREERDQLLSALEVQLKNLLCSNAEKEKEIENLKKLNGVHEDSTVGEEVKRQFSASEEKVKELQGKLSQLEQLQTSSAAMTPLEKVENTECQTAGIPESVTQRHTNSSSSNSDISPQDASDTVLDSSVISTENGRASRFPKPQMEISFSPVKPNKMEVKHLGDDSPITVKISRSRKRKSNEMEQEVVKNENRKNTRTNKMTPQITGSPVINRNEMKKQTLTKQPSTSSTASNRKKDGTLQKLGEFFQSSPSIFQHKAKKLLETIGAPKGPDVILSRKEEETKPKKSRRKLYTAEISAPLDIPAHAIIMDSNEKESDHQIMKRRLRTRTAK